MSERQDLERYMFEGHEMNVVYLHNTAVPTRTDVTHGCFCVIDYPGDGSDHDIYIYGDATVDTDAWILVHNET